MSGPVTPTKGNRDPWLLRRILGAMHVGPPHSADLTWLAALGLDTVDQIEAEARAAALAEVRREVAGLYEWPLHDRSTQVCIATRGDLLDGLTDILDRLGAPDAPSAPLLAAPDQPAERQPSCGCDPLLGHELRNHAAIATPQPTEEEGA